MLKDPDLRAFAIHLAAYVAVTLIAVAVNLWLTPQTLWFVWVLAGWGIGVAAHGLALYLRKTRRRERIFVDKKTRGFTVHAFAYVAVVILLFIVNLTVTPQTWWFYWVALGWGAGIAAHGWCAFYRRRGAPQQTSASKSEPDKKAPRRKAAARRKKT